MDNIKWPEGFICPISHEVMKTPVVASCGHTFEQTCIKKWLTDHDTCPLDRQKIDRYNLPINFSVKQAIEEMKKSSKNNSNSGKSCSHHDIQVIKQEKSKSNQTILSAIQQNQVKQDQQNKRVPKLFQSSIREQQQSQSVQLANELPKDSPGLCIRVKCTNQQCVNYDREIFIPKGLGNFNINKELCICKCLQCDAQMKSANAFALINCYYELDGLTRDRIQVTEKKHIQNPPYRIFNELDAKWLAINVQVRTT